MSGSDWEFQGKSLVGEVHTGYGAPFRVNVVRLRNEAEGVTRALVEVRHDKAMGFWDSIQLSAEGWSQLLPMVQVGCRMAGGRLEGGALDER